MTSNAGFIAEQETLGKIWTFLGFASDIPAKNDWFRTTLGGRSIFVQRFDDTIRAFVNRCAHRFYPLRTCDRGNGPVVCGFHHWRYNSDGIAIGIPHCQAFFGATPRELDKRLSEIEISQCGTMLFGRFASGSNVSLADWLGDGFDFLKSLALEPPQANRIDEEISANWKLNMQISLDDYHVVAVHPSTFGATGYIKPERTQYVRFGAHSAYFNGTDNAIFSKTIAACKDGSYRPHGYHVFQFFPNLIVAVVKACDYLGDRYWFAVVQRLVPERYDQTRSISRFAPLPFARPAGFMLTRARALAMPWVTMIFHYYARKTHREDNAVVETLQRNAQLWCSNPTLGLQEQRIAWFEEAYLTVMNNELRD